MSTLAIILCVLFLIFGAGTAIALILCAYPRRKHYGTVRRTEINHGVHYD